MKTLLSLFFYLLNSNLALALTLAPDTSVEHELDKISKHSTIVLTKLSPDKKTEVVLFESIKPREKEELPRQILKITTPDKVWLMESGDSRNFTKIRFLNNQHLLYTEGGLTNNATLDIDLETRQIRYLGQGEFEILDGNFIKLYGQKHYFPAPEWGAFWVDMIVDTHGNVIEVLSPNSQYLGECVPLNLILDQENKHPKLKQSMEDCVYVER